MSFGVCEKPYSRGPKKGEPRTGTPAGYLAHSRAGEDSCDPCRLAENERTRKRHRQKYRNDPEFRERERKRNRERYRNDPEFRERTLKQDRIRRAERKAAGMCASCDNPIANEGGTLCADHLAELSEYGKEKARKSVEQGECARSGCTQSLRSDWFCDDHLNEHRLYEKARREQKRRKEILNIAGIEYE